MKKIKLLVIVLGILLFGRSFLVQKVSIDVLNKTTNGYSRVELSKEDGKTIRKIICPKIAMRDKGFVFEEGNYRIIFETFGIELHLYPYCGSPDTLRVGDKGSWLIELDFIDETESETIREIANKYIGGADGIGDWSNSEELIKKAMRIQYGWGRKKQLKSICTEEFVKSKDFENVYLGRKLYSVDEGYMKNVQKISENEIQISVHVYSPDILIHCFTLEKTRDGQYLISNIEHDI